MKRSLAILGSLANRKEAYNREIAQEDGLIELDREMLEKLHDTLFGMYKDIYAVCKKHGLTPFLAGGSALGAVRHKGFIPWDDDLDIAMTRQDYEIFRSIFRKELGAAYILNAPNYSKYPKARFPKVMKKGTLCRGIEDYSEPEQCGIFIDLFIIENIPANRFIRFMKGVFCNGLEFLAGQAALMEHYNEGTRELMEKEGRAVAAVRKTVGTLFGSVPSGAWYAGIDKAVRSNKTTGYAGLPTGRLHYLGEIFETKVIFPARYIEFCGIQAPVFTDVETYLMNLYGDDFMQEPPPDKREKHFFTELKFDT